MGGRYRTVGETQYRFELRLEITRVQLTGDLTGVGEIGPKSLPLQLHGECLRKDFLSFL